MGAKKEVNDDGEFDVLVKHSTADESLPSKSRSKKPTMKRSSAFTDEDFQQLGY